jgi:hypothetical protein
LYTSTAGAAPTPCLFYMPYNRPACVYPDITLPSLTVSTLAAHAPDLTLAPAEVARLLYKR